MALLLRLVPGRSRSIARSLRPHRFLASLAHGDDAAAEGMAAQILDYAAAARKKGGAGYLDAMQVLEHGVSFVKNSGPSAANALCKIQFAIADFHADQGKVSDATEVLHGVSSNESAGLEVRVSALEALVGLYLQIHEDELASAQLQTISELATPESDIGPRSQALAGLVKLSGGQFDAAAASCFEAFPPDTKQGAAILSRAEVAHVRGDDKEAKNFYESAAALAKNETDKSKGATMTSTEVHSAALAGLGQLSADLGCFDEAEKFLTEGLQVAESISGETHARVGLVLSCMADLYSRRAKAENSGFMIAEGLYRRSLNLLKAPPLEKEAKDKLQYLDAIAITRARYADILSSVEQRASEAERLKSWATAAWRNQRSLSDVLKAAARDNGSKLHSVIDVRLGRVF
ncbi:uncharacterized protein LOC9662180 isoform X1 [Selaginella moellendorffii]|nr:uncharacterized protein LOC9662180 isoform X1 [Selaginella moellendorffii]|eukprot:XP_002962915.2 uncharacterized protein LOC9662180 isoform X1 [Selaginella moellendorffii]